MAAALKPLPVPTLSKLVPPPEEHAFFEGYRKVPFDPSDTNFSLTKAWWLAEASLLAYGDEAFIRRKLKESGLDETQGFNARVFVGPIRGSQCVVLETDHFVAVAFRGTRIKSVPDPVMNLKLWLIDEVDLSTDVDIRIDPSTRAHLGFSRAIDEVWDSIREHLDSIMAKNRDRTLWFTGHSLGAALATLAAERYGDDRISGVYTFGSPRVGDSTFAGRFLVPCFRFVNNADLIPHVPPPGYPTDYTHVGALKFIDCQGAILDDPKLFDVLDSNARGHLQAIKTGILAFNPSSLQEAGKAIFDAFRTLDLGKLSTTLETLNLDFVPLVALADHAPLNYAIQVWNALARETV